MRWSSHHGRHGSTHVHGGAPLPASGAGHRRAAQQAAADWATLRVTDPRQVTGARGRVWFGYQATVEVRAVDGGTPPPDRTQVRCILSSPSEAPPGQPLRHFADGSPEPNHSAQCPVRRHLVVAKQGGRVERADESAVRALHEARAHAEVGRGDEARAVLARAEVTLLRRSSRTRTPRAADVVSRALAEVRAQRIGLDRAAGRLRPAKGLTSPATVPARLSHAAQLIGLGRLSSARAVLKGMDAELANRNLCDYDPLVLRAARLWDQLEPAPPASRRVPAEGPPSSVRTVTGGLPTLGRRR